MASAAGRALPVVTDAERAVADLLPIETDPAAARRALARLPLWFHTFALNREHGMYTPGVARDHRYRVRFLPVSFAGERVLDVGTFDGFYAFLAECCGAAYVVAVDNEQYVAWVRARWGIELQGGEGFATIAELLGSRVQYPPRGRARARRRRGALRRRALLRDPAPGREPARVAAAPRRAAGLAGLPAARVDGTFVVDGHPRIMATLTRAD